MARGYDRLETRGPRVREREQMETLAASIAVLARKRLWRKRFSGVEAAALRHWRDLAAIPVTGVTTTTPAVTQFGVTRTVPAVTTQPSTAVTASAPTQAPVTRQVVVVRRSRAS